MSKSQETTSADEQITVKLIKSQLRIDQVDEERRKKTLHPNPHLQKKENPIDPENIPDPI